MSQSMAASAEGLLCRYALVAMQVLLLGYQFGQQIYTVMYWTLWLVYTRVVSQTLMPWRAPPKLNKQPRHIAVCLQKHILSNVDRERVALSVVQWCLDAGAIQVTLYEPTDSLGKDFPLKLETHLGSFLHDNKNSKNKSGALFHGACSSAIDGPPIKLKVRTGNGHEEVISRSTTEQQPISTDDRTVLLLSKRDGYTDAARVARETISEVLHGGDTQVKFANMKANMSAHRGMNNVDLVVRIQDMSCQNGSDDLPPFILAGAEIMTIRPVLFGLWTIYPLFLDALVTFAGSQQRWGK